MSAQDPAALRFDTHYSPLRDSILSRIGGVNLDVLDLLIASADNASRETLNVAELSDFVTCCRRQVTAYCGAVPPSPVIIAASRASSTTALRA